MHFCFILQVIQPFQRNSVRSKRNVQKKRKNKSENRNPLIDLHVDHHKSCQIKTLYVSFKDLNWQVCIETYMILYKQCTLLARLETRIKRRKYGEPCNQNVCTILVLCSTCNRATYFMAEQVRQARSMEQNILFFLYIFFISTLPSPTYSLI